MERESGHGRAGASYAVPHEAERGEPEWPRIRVLLVHPDRLFREALAVAVACQHRTMQVVGHVGALEHLGKRCFGPAQVPTVILVSGSKTPGDFLTDARRLRMHYPAAHVLCVGLSVVSRAPSALGRETGGSREGSLRGVLQAILHLGRGRIVQPVSSGARLFSSEPVRPMTPGTRSVLSGLTRREQDILALRRRGRSNKEIAVTLQIELQTVKNHLRSIFVKTRATAPAGPGET